MEAIFLPTVRHSGTIFLQKFFQKGGYKLVNVDRMMFAGEYLPPTTRAIIHTHIDVNLPVVRSLHAQKPNPNHLLGINYYANFNEYLILALAGAMPTVVPMRDPLLSIITRHSRHPEQAPHTYLIESWQPLCDFRNLFFVPVDLPWTTDERVGLLNSMLAHCKAEPWPGVNDYAREWEPINAVPGGAPQARAAYARKDKGWFEEHFPEEWEALGAAGDVRDLFEQEGYEDLLWW